MAAVTTCGDFGAPKNKVWHCFHCFRSGMLSAFKAQAVMVAKKEKELKFTYVFTHLHKCVCAPCKAVSIFFPFYRWEYWVWGQKLTSQVTVCSPSTFSVKQRQRSMQPQFLSTEVWVTWCIEAVGFSSAHVTKSIFKFDQRTRYTNNPFSEVLRDYRGWIMIRRKNSCVFSLSLCLSLSLTFSFHFLIRPKESNHLPEISWLNCLENSFNDSCWLGSRWFSFAD